MKIWICTGDKLETTLGVASACNLFSNSSSQSCVKISGEKFEDVGVELNTARETAFANNNSIDLVTISGASLALILSDVTIYELMLQLLAMANSVVFVRMAPSQKSKVIELAKSHLNMKVMAIGDGYNDTQMLQAADCGIRIVKPTSVHDQDRAIKAEADFIITNFFQVKKLVLAHGFNSNHQISRLIYFYFYKNVALVGCEVAFQFVSGFSR